MPYRARLVAVVAAAGTCGPIAGYAADMPRHHQASSWRTVVIPMKGVTTASISPAAQSKITRPLTGVAHGLQGIASFYWQGQRTASGETFNPADMTAAHRTLPFGTKVRVTHNASGRNVVVRINDRGPFKPGRVIDLSKAAAEKLQMTGAGLAAVSLEVVD